VAGSANTQSPVGRIEQGAGWLRKREKITVVIPAKAGTQPSELGELGPGFRRDDGLNYVGNRSDD